MWEDFNTDIMFSIGFQDFLFIFNLLLLARYIMYNEQINDHTSVNTFCHVKMKVLLFTALSSSHNKIKKKLFCPCTVNKLCQ